MPRKGSEDHVAVMKIMKGEAAAPAKPKMTKATLMERVRETKARAAMGAEDRDAPAPTKARMTKAKLMERVRETKARAAMGAEDRDVPAPRPRRTKEELMAAIKAIKERGMTKERKAKLMAEVRNIIELKKERMRRAAMGMQDIRDREPEEVLDVEIPEPRVYTKAELVARAKAMKAMKAAEKAREAREKKKAEKAALALEDKPIAEIRRIAKALMPNITVQKIEKDKLIDAIKKMQAIEAASKARLAAIEDALDEEE